MMTLSRRASNPYTLTNGTVRARTHIMVAASTRLGSVASEATNTPDLTKTAIPVNKAISPT